MRISPDTRFPHPVLAPETNDYLEGEFQVDFEATEDLSTGALQLQHKVILTEQRIARLVEEGRANIGCFVRCPDTYFAELRPLSWPTGRTDFQPGALLNRVTLQPIVWLASSIPDWDPGTIHEEFDPPISLSSGDILAVAPERAMSIGLAKLAALETIFDLRKSDAVPPGQIQVAPDFDRIAILAAPDLFNVVSTLRGRVSDRPIVMTGVYMPAIMELLDILRTAQKTYDHRRWFQPFMAKCDSLGVTLTSGCSSLDIAQRLLGSPLGTLAQFTAEGEV